MYIAAFTHCYPDEASDDASKYLSVLFVVAPRGALYHTDLLNRGRRPGGAGGTVVYWGVSDAVAEHQRLLDLGAEMRSGVQDVGSGIIKEKCFVLDLAELSPTLFGAGESSFSMH